MGGVYNFQHTNTQHGNTNGSVLGHHPSYSGGLTSSTPSFTPQSLQNGHSGTTQGGQAQQITEHWAEQIKQHKAALDAHSAMIDHHAPNHYARIKAGENRGISSAASTTTISTEEVEYDTRGRPSNLDSNPYAKRQDWHSMDLSGQGIRSLAPSLFVYTFLTELYVPSNKLTQLPAAIGQLRALRHLDASNNQLKHLPPELGMCVYLKNLLLFDNQLTTLPNELGSLHQLDMLGIEGNRNLDPDIKTEIMERGTKSLIHQLRENAPGNLNQLHLYYVLTDGLKFPFHLHRERFSIFQMEPLLVKTDLKYSHITSFAKRLPLLSSMATRHLEP
jgi:CCR4-NOT transcription complex subunit 6